MVITSSARLLVVCAMLTLPPVDGELAADPQIKPPIRGLVSMGAYRFVGKGGDPVNTLEPLNAKPGIFGGLVIIATWKQLQPTPDSEIGDNNVIDQALAEVRAYNARNPDRPLAVKLRVWGGFEVPDWAMRLGGGAPIQTVHNGTERVLATYRRSRRWRIRCVRPAIPTRRIGNAWRTPLPTTRRGKRRGSCFRSIRFMD